MLLGRYLLLLFHRLRLRLLRSRSTSHQDEFYELFAVDLHQFRIIVLAVEYFEENLVYLFVNLNLIVLGHLIVLG